MAIIDNITKEVVITADSTCDLPKHIVEKNQIIITPLSILLGEDAYTDGVDVTPKDIYEYVGKTKNLPKTAAVTPNYYADLFKQLTDAGKQVVHIGLSSAISSSYHNAVIAAEEFDNVYCVDSKSLCTGMGLLVLKACDYRDDGNDARTVSLKISNLVPKVSTTFIVDNLEYLHKGGRCSGVAKFGANVLGIKPSIAVNNDTGKLDVAKKYRGKADIVYKQYVNDCLRDVDNIDKSRIVIANSGKIDLKTLDYVKGLVSNSADFDEIIEADAGCTISSHCGPKTLAIFYIRK